MGLYFKLTDHQDVMLRNWDLDHDCEIKKRGESLDGRISVEFTFKEKGIDAKARCKCGAEIELENTFEQ